MGEVNKSACEQLCPKYLLCEKMVQTGIAHRMLSVSTTSSVEYEADDGRLISSAEFWGTTDLTDEEIAIHDQAGTALQDGGRGLQKALLEGCPAGGPLEIGRGTENAFLLCQSSNKSAVEFTEADLQ
ncbi:MAG: hypothetical protein WC657_04905 [Candidatus Paceibacterota bacterium]|jgi:hypothetical protein